MAVEACVKILSSFRCGYLQKVSKQQRERATFFIFEKIFNISFSNFDATLHILFAVYGIFLVV